MAVRSEISQVSVGCILLSRGTQRVGIGEKPIVERAVAFCRADDLSSRFQKVSTRGQAATPPRPVQRSPTQHTQPLDSLTSLARTGKGVWHPVARDFQQGPPHSRSTHLRGRLPALGGRHRSSGRKRHAHRRWQDRPQLEIIAQRNLTHNFRHTV